MGKTFFSRVAFLTILVIFGCSSDKDESESDISEQQLNAIVGTWTLVSYEVNPPQDVNGDSTPSENLLEELDCLTGSLTFTSEFQWSRALVEINAAPITGGAFGISCGPTSNNSGDWLFLENRILLDEGAEGSYELDGNTMVRVPGEDLPGVRQLVYQKM